ncbi:Ras guanine-nucleotide exchange protein [Pelomyxa schiedti]|nr:Ras guanine-nucleotide exchange protein [Pelomyxa schiedti]
MSSVEGGVVSPSTTPASSPDPQIQQPPQQPGTTATPAIATTPGISPATTPTIITTPDPLDSSDHRHSRKQRRSPSLLKIVDPSSEKDIPLRVSLNTSHHHRHHAQTVAFIELAPSSSPSLAPLPAPASPTPDEEQEPSSTTQGSTPADSDIVSNELFVGVTCPCCNSQFNLSDANLVLRKTNKTSTTTTTAASMSTFNRHHVSVIEHRPRASSASASDMRTPKLIEDMAKNSVYLDAGSSSSTSPRPGSRVAVQDEREEDMPRFTDARFLKVEEPYSDSNSIFSEAEEGSSTHLKAATIHKLVHYFTSDLQVKKGGDDDDDMGSFLLTFRVFSTSSEFLELLHSRFFSPKPEGLEWDLYRRTKLNQIRLRISNLMKYWFMLCPEDFKYDPALQEQCRQTLAEFAERFPPCRVLIGTLQTVIDTRPQIIQNVGVQRTPPPTPMLYEDVSHITCFLDLHPEEVARQMALIEYESFMKIRSSEFVYKMASKNRDNFKNITEMTTKINRHVNWVSTEILTQKDIATRAFILHKFVLVAMASLGLNNLSTVKEIMSSLGSSAIHRLRATWRILPANTMEIFHQLERFISSDDNHNEYRSRLQTICEKHPKLPCVPFLGISITDCLFLNQGNPDTMESSSGEKMINFAKWRRLAKVIRELAKFQGTTYNLTPLYSIQHYLETTHVEESEDVLFELSKALEDGSATPNPKDEKYIQKLAKKIAKEDKRKLQKHPHIDVKPKDATEGKPRSGSSS